MALYKVDSDTADLTLVAGSTIYSDAPIGTIFPYGGTTVPAGFLMCNGQTVSRTTYSELFSVIQTRYGVGNGSTTFRLPDYGGLFDYTNTNTIGDYLVNWTTSYQQGSGSQSFNVTKSGFHEIYYAFNQSSPKDFNRLELYSPDNILLWSKGYAGVGPREDRDYVWLEKGNNYHCSHDGGNNAVDGYCTVRILKNVGSNTNFIIKAKVLGSSSDATQQSINTINATLPYSFNKSSNIGAFNRKFVHEANSLSWTATHTGRLTLRLLKNGDGYSLYFYNTTTNTLIDSYDNFFGTDSQSAGCTQASITLQGWVRKGDSIKLESNLPSSTALDHMFFCQTGLLAYNDNYD